MKREIRGIILVVGFVFVLLLGVLFYIEQGGTAEQPQQIQTPQLPVSTSSVVVNTTSTEVSNTSTGIIASSSIVSPPQISGAEYRCLPAADSPNPSGFTDFSATVRQFVGQTESGGAYEVEILKSFLGKSVTGTVIVVPGPYGIRGVSPLQPGETYIFLYTTYDPNKDRYMISLIETPEQCKSGLPHGPQ